MKTGDYIRNKYGIAKIIDIKKNDEGIDICYFDNDIAFIFDTKLKEEKRRTHILPLTNNVDINKIKHSPNIIDLIEVGDYVNGCPVLHIEGNELVCGLILRYKEKNIQNIVTKEQFEAIQYNLES